MNKSFISLVPAIRMITSSEQLSTVRLFEKENINEIVADNGFVKENSINLILTEKQSEEDIINNLKDKISEYKANCGINPYYIIINNDIVLMVSPNAFINNLLEELLISEYDNGNTKNNNEIINEIKNSKKSIENQKVFNKIFIVTGGAQGFGEGIVKDLFSQGANIVIADLNSNKGLELANFLNEKGQLNKVIFQKTDISDSKSVEELVNITVKHFGGIDVLISNAGILYAGGLDEMKPETFELMTKVNYTGYFICTKYVSAVMRQQSKYSDNYFMDIIQINSKSGLRGSNKNFAYAGGKFGGIGLTQSFALELIPYRIKVNSICPGNFFEGPLWSDPEKGLFVQYLKAGKVPGAKTIEDVKKYYEKQVPANRGCRIEDVMKAIYYAIDQEYETGQAIPVTGGQVMLN
jgi:NAD(P)-dependent dehydrogenase (short-subunit alcohol dehydrogenase family)